MSVPTTQVRRALGAVLGALLAVALLSPAPAQAQETQEAQESELHLVTLAGPGLATGPSTAANAGQLHATQDRVLAAVGAGAPVYRWTHALNGVAVRLDDRQVERLRRHPQVERVERNRVRPLAAARRPGLAGEVLDTGRTRGGAGVVIGVVDTGISPDHPLFAPVPSLGGATPGGFSGDCQSGQNWPADTCHSKLVGAGWFVDGFGSDRLSSSASLSARDDDGHGTQVASIAAGNPGLPVRVNGEDLGEYAGLAPQARVAAYKACWTAPDPADDGCATADLVSAVDRAAADGVDVLNLSVGGSGSPRDTFSRALLGATESGVLVVTAAGNRPDAAGGAPWTLTVGGATTDQPTATLRHRGEELADGVSATTRTVGPARIVVGSRVAAGADADVDAARLCLPGSLDAGKVSGALVLCERGRVGRVDKSRTVRNADGAGMILVNRGPGSLDADLHSVPTVHLDAGAGDRLRAWARRHPDATVRLTPSGATGDAPRPASWSPHGATEGLVAPDLLAPGHGLVGGVPEAVSRAGWDVLSGTSAAAAYTSGTAARLLASTGWGPDEVRSALTTTARPVRGAVDRVGAGLLSEEDAQRPGLVVTAPERQYRRHLDGHPAEVNTTSIVVDGPGSTRTATRTLTHHGSQARYYSANVAGFDRVDVSVTPEAVRLSPGESATFTVTVRGRPDQAEGGYVVWRGATGTRTRFPVSVR